MCCIQAMRLDPEDQFVHKAYTKEVYALAYPLKFHALPGISQWEEADSIGPEPLECRSMPGRPSKKKRIKEKGEVREELPDEGLVVRQRKPNQCSNCGGYGHNKAKCSDPTSSNIKTSKAKVVIEGPTKKRGRTPKNATIQRGKHN